MDDNHTLDLTASELDRTLAAAQFISNPNLLDNWYFVHPVNQRGRTEYTGNGYTIDRWYARKAMVEVTASGLRITKVTNNDNTAYNQRFEVPANLIGKTVTVSALVKEVSFSGRGIRLGLARSNSISTNSGPFENVYYEAKTGIITSTFKVDSLDAYSGINLEIFFSTDSALGDYILVEAVKLELGSVQTLAHHENGVWVLNEIPNYAEELAKCQRYYQLFSSADKRPSDKRDFRPELRTDATSANTGTIEIDGVTYYYADANL